MNRKRAGVQQAFSILETHSIPTRLLSGFESGSRGNRFHASPSSGAHPPPYRASFGINHGGGLGSSGGQSEPNPPRTADTSLLTPTPGLLLPAEVAEKALETDRVVDGNVGALRR